MASGQEDADEFRRDYRAPYTQKHQIPTIQKYRQEKEARKANALTDYESGNTEGDDSKLKDRAKQSWSSYWYGEKNEPRSGPEKEDLQNGKHEERNARSHADEDDDDDDEDDEDDTDQAAAVDTSEANPLSRDPKQRRKGMRKKDDRAEREVTDPVTHLPVKIFDFTQGALKDVEENPSPFGTTPRTATGLSNKKKSGRELHDEIRELQDGHESMSSLFPPPSYDELRMDLIDIVKRGMTVGLVAAAGVILVAFGVERQLVRLERTTWIFGVSTWIFIGVASMLVILYLISTVRAWMANRIRDVWAARVWEASRESSVRDAKAHETESVSWLNSLVGAVWPLINPDLFTSLADTLEDVMQASLPGLVQMVSVEDIGQGAEALRILGIRWLPSGAAARSVGEGGKLESVDGSKKSQNDRAVPGEGEVDKTASTDGDDTKEKVKDDKKDKKDNNAKQQQSDDGAQKSQIAEGMEAEEGDFINLEVAFAYRARPPKSMQDRSKDIHLYLAFYLPGALKIPIWVDIKGIIGTARLRLQLAPDPPFFALCTLTFLGQPKVDISCIPLIKYGPNIMDLPLIKNFVQSSVDAAMAEYVAPKSLTLNLKDMLAGDDFKKDTNARGILVVYIKSGHDFKCGDAAIPLIREAGADPYVSVGFAKFGKPMWSTRVLQKEMNPVWEERCFLAITPEELNVDERLRVQLWDSDRFTADDDLGRIEVDIKEIMRSDESNGRMCDRTDGFRALKKGEDMPGKLEWSVGYFSKTRLQKCQFEKQTFDPEVKSMEQLQKKVDEISRKKLREARTKKGRHSKSDSEMKQQRDQELKMYQDAMTISAPPPENYPSGIFSIQIHQITGLELSDLNKGEADRAGLDYEEMEAGKGLPSAYCTVIINHKKIFKTRTKPKNARPFYNAGTERFINDWHNAEVFVTIRDQRTDEDDPLLGIVRLQLGEVFAKRAQIDDWYPITGGVGFGRVRLSMVWRSVQLQAPEEWLGWDFGTLEIQPQIEASKDLPDDLKSLSVKFQTSISTGKMHSESSEGMQWKTRKGRSLKLAVQQRYSSCLTLRWKHKTAFKDRTHAFAVLWLKDIPDEEDGELTLPVWKGDFERARASCVQECGEKVGTVDIKLRFWSGLGSAHTKWARKDPNLRNVMEVLEVAHDNLETQKAERAAGIVEGDGDLSSEDDDDSSDDESTHDHDRGDKSNNGNSEEKANEKLSLIDQAKDYKQHARVQQRQNRGIMQYKLPRSAQWAFHKAERVEHKIGGIFRRHTRQPGIETEV